MQLCPIIYREPAWRRGGCREPYLHHFLGGDRLPDATALFSFTLCWWGVSGSGEREREALREGEREADLPLGGGESSVHLQPSSLKSSLVALQGWGVSPLRFTNLNRSRQNQCSCLRWDDHVDTHQSTFQRRPSMVTPSIFFHAYEASLALRGQAAEGR